jgi:hypothetical protein
MSYGNICIVLESNEEQMTAVEILFTAQAKKYEKVNSTFFVETATIKATNNLISDVTATGATFIFFHNKISDGSYVKASGVSEEVRIRVNEILF